MKFLPVQFAYFLQGTTARRNLGLPVRLVVLLAALIIGYSVVSTS